MRPRLSVIVPFPASAASPASEEQVLACLRSLEDHPPALPFELILVSDGRPGLLDRLEGNVTVVPVPRPASGMDALYAGAARAGGELLLFLDPSVRLLPGWFAPLLAGLEVSTVAAVQPRMLDARGRLAHAGGVTLSDGRPAVYGRDAEFPDAPAYACRREPDFVSTLCLLLRSEALGAAGGIRSEAGFSSALREAGWTLAYEPESRVVATAGVVVPDGEPDGDGFELDHRAHRASSGADRGRPAVLFVDSEVPASPGDRLEQVARLRRSGHFVACHLLDGTDRAPWARALGALGVPCYGADPAVKPGDPAAAARRRKAYGAHLPGLLVRFPFGVVVFGDDAARRQSLAYVRVFAPGASVASGPDEPGFTLPATGAGSRVPEKARSPLVSACLIVKDEEERLPDCLLSLGDLVDEVVVVDTGSSDATRELARAAGCRVVEAPWTDDFSAARNVSLEAASGEWALVIDADERVECSRTKGLRKFLAGTQLDLLQLLCRSELGDTDGVGVAEHRVSRLFRRSRYRFEGRVHEQPVPLAGGPLEGATSVLWLRHDGYRPSVFAERGKRDRNESIARANYDAGIGEQWYRAHTAARSTGAPEDRIRLYREALHHLPDHELRFRVDALCGLARSLVQVGQAEEALDLARAAVALAPGSAQARCVLGTALNFLDRHDEAVAVLRALVEGPETNDDLIFESDYRLVNGPIQLAYAYSALGDVAATARHLCVVAGRDPATFPAWPSLVEAVRRSHPEDWAGRLTSLAAPCLPTLVASSRALPAPDRLHLIEACAAAGLPAVGAVYAALEAIPNLEDPEAALRRWEDWLGRLDALPGPVSDQLARRLESSAPASALRIWERMDRTPASALGCARCHAALGSPARAVDAIADLELAELPAPDLLFVTTLALTVGDRQTADALLDLIRPGDGGVTAEQVVEIAAAVGPETLDRIRRRFSGRAA